MLNFEVAKPTAVDPTRLGDETLASVSGGKQCRQDACIDRKHGGQRHVHDAERATKRANTLAEGTFRVIKL